MVTKKITIHRALTELKTIGDRIDKKINTLDCVGIKKDGKVNIHYTPEEFEKKATSELESVSGLILRQNKIKYAIIKSNAVTKISVGGGEFTVAEAIAYKRLMVSEERLCKKLKTVHDSSKLNVEKALISIENNALTMGQNMDPTASQDKNRNSESVNLVMEQYRERNQVELFDPLKVMDRHKELEEKLAQFVLDIDGALSESNAVTTIEV